MHAFQQGIAEYLSARLQPSDVPIVDRGKALHAF